ncbi:hypothetical protein LOTGIDRAFT_229391 [Lottia gigantea]|uniref:SUEL-type lectin domain-containing protein n=1 Tax=Lottia gigantea TaxID=225164 RepID=V3ZXL4_LOTGI|nr:hypothetical protein LOTGIDRAFT_229391 [Lottia gigantea]ESO87330.1 hypothetical protein LOTGIDRAFT_229391 [Lottia gigantea]
MQNPIEACLIIPMMLLVPMIESSSIACLRHGDKTCSGHTLTCEDGKVIRIIDAVFGFRIGCGPQLAPKHSTCSSPCCQYMEDDCFLEFSENELREVNSNCSGKEDCKFTKFAFHITQNPSECKDKNIYINAYTRINYECVSRRTSSTSKWPWTRSSVEPLSKIQTPITTSQTAIVSSQSEANTTTSPIKVASTTVKTHTDHQSNKQPSGAVIGGIVSGVILMVVLIMITIFFIKRHRMNPMQAPKRHMPRTVSREIRISAPIALQNTTNTTICNSQQNCRNSNSNSEYENVEAESLQTFYSSLSPETQSELQPPGGDTYNHLGEDNSQSLDLSDYNHTSDFCEYSDNYHHISADEFKRREANLVNCDYNHIHDTIEEKKST